ncbi:unnamed protein product [Cylindrotheca closterium]|uniref:HSF-type DNA-binding domain-containing protein n=1 Tax=Cylindrotheca closterium TaxID=2856 RepID=A0AAD2GCT0_9STRA|nr:unnamed protein product [Cylindrotheca closterium]
MANISHLSFPEKVYQVLQLCEENGRTDIISWMNDGTAFKVHDLKEFERDFLPNYFNTKKYASFTRTLCAYGFTGVRTGRQTGIYSHPDFNRNDPAAPSLMRRVKKTQKSASSPSITKSRSGSEAALGGSFHSVGAKIADGLTYLLVRLPPGAEVVGTFDAGKFKSNPAYHNPPKPIAHHDSVTKSIPEDVRDEIYSINKDFSGDMGADELEPTKMFPPTDMDATKQDNGFFDDDAFEPIPMSYEEQEPAVSFEPRTVEEIMETPMDLNLWYKCFPIIPTAKVAACVEYASPFSMPLLCQYLDMSSFGMAWVYVFSVGHTIQALLTDYGPNSEYFRLSPTIGIVPHHFMDIMWMHTHFAGLVLYPALFGPDAMVLFKAFIFTQPLNLAAGLKTNYNYIETKSGAWEDGRFWVAEIVRWVMLGSIAAFLTILAGESYGIENLKVIGLFVSNLSVLWAWGSYQTLLSYHESVENKIMAKKVD